MTFKRTIVLIGFLIACAAMFAVPILAQRDEDGTSNEKSAKPSTDKGSTDDPDHHPDDPRFQLSLIGSGFGPKLENLQGAISNTKTRFTQLESIRRQFWAAQSGDPKREILKEHYAEALLEKDIQLLYGGVTTGSGGFMNAINRLALDGGVAEAARPVFDRWVEAIRDHMGIRDNQRYQQLENLNAFNLDRFSQAFEATRQFEEQYMLLRDWNEYLKAGRTQDFYATPEAYVIYLQRVDGEPLSQPQAVARYRKLAAMFGEKTLTTTANKQRAKPANADGLIRGSRMKPMYDFFEQVSQGSDAGFIFNQFRMVARSEDRWAEAISDFQEMITLIDAKVALTAAAEARRDPNATLGDFVRVLSQAGDRECFLTVAARAKGMQWNAASQQYQALCEIYGEDTVLRAARKVRTARSIDNYQIEIPPELADGKRISKSSSVYCDDAIARLLKLEPRKAESEETLYIGATTTLSKDNAIKSPLLPSKYLGGRIAMDSEGVAFSVAGVPGLLGGLFGGSGTTSRAAIFKTQSDSKPVAVQGITIGSFGQAMDLSSKYLVVGFPSAWLSNPKTGRGPRLNAGEAYVYSRMTGELVTNVRPPRDSLMPGLWFGTAVAAYGDLIAVGATGKRGTAEDEGEVNIHDAATGEHRFRITLRPEDRAHRAFGANIATDGKILLITAPGADEVSRRSPGVFLHDARDGKFLAKLEYPASERSVAGLGSSIAVSGRWAVVGFSSDSDGGSVLVYDVSTGKLHSVLKNTTTYRNTADLGDGVLRSLIVRADQLDYSFGEHVAVSGDAIVIASQRSLHIFDAESSRHRQTIPVGKDINSDRIAIHDVAIDGTTIIATTQDGEGENWTHHRVEIDQPSIR